ncbi:MAG: hypothetical protein J6C77_00320 [Muribaculaceae bacterium]|nr:hypothetical protein [Muribaculaceae bacterium]
MNDNTMNQLRYRHFLATCERLAVTPGMKIRDERHLVKLAINQEAPFFYVTPRYALQRIYQLNANYRGTLATMRPLARQMWMEIYRQVYAEACRNGMRYAEAVNKVLRECRAPRFYFDVATGLLIRRRARRQKSVAR